MSDLALYLLKVNVAVTLFYLVYHFLLRRLTFYMLNRVYLQFGLLFSVLYPLIDFRSWFAAKEEFPVAVQYIILDWGTDPAAADGGFNYWGYIHGVFWVIAGYFAVRLLVRLFSLWQIHRGSVPAVWRVFRYRYVQEPIMPFSFWQHIYVHTDGQEDRELYDIFNHEQVHVDQLHTLDTLLTEVITLICWFNPFGWLIRHAVRQNLEFITDREVVRSGVDKRRYQYSLLSLCQSANLQARRLGTGGQSESHGVTNNFNFKDLKIRIMMMNKKRSPVTHISRYALAIPGVVAIALLLAVTFSRSRAQESPLSLDHLSSGEMADEFAPALVDGASPADPAIRIEPNIEQLSLSSKPDTLVIHRADSSRSGKTSFKAVIRSATDGEDSKQPMYVIDGKVVDLVDALDDIDLNSIESVTVLKDRHALELYGEAGRNGVILIATKVKTPTADLRIRRGVGPIFIPDSIQESLPSTVRGEFKVRRVADFPDSIRLRFTPKIQIDTLVSRQLVMRLHETPPYNTPFVLIDGLRGDLSELPPERIKSISVLKGDRALVDQYGPGAMWGVIKVETKE